MFNPFTFQPQALTLKSCRLYYIGPVVEQPTHNPNINGSNPFCRYLEIENGGKSCSFLSVFKFQSARRGEDIALIAGQLVFAFNLRLFLPFSLQDCLCKYPFKESKLKF